MFFLSRRERKEERGSAIRENRNHRILRHIVFHVKNTDVDSFSFLLPLPNPPPSGEGTNNMQKKFHIVGILNTTPDSYFDGGKYVSVSQAVERAEQMLDEGADIIEVGGESTIPSGDGGISIEEELQRTIPMIRAIRDTFPHANISIDTYKSEVAKEAIEAGVMMVNDVTAGRGDPEMFSVLRNADVKIVLMFAKELPPLAKIHNTRYDDVVSTVFEFLRERKRVAMESGIGVPRIILDPGLGFFISSDARYSFQILAHLKRFTEFDCPIFVSPSRKSFLAGAAKLSPDDRLPATIAASAIAVLNGATYIRTHDVAAVKRGCEFVFMMDRGMR